jgi:hypothetical protein
MQCLIRTGSKICTARSDLTFSNKHFDSVAMPCPACLVARRRVESFNVTEIRNYEMHLTVSHGMER